MQVTAQLPDHSPLITSLSGGELRDAEKLLSSFRIFKVIDTNSCIPGHELAFKVGLCSAIRCYLKQNDSGNLFNQLFVTTRRGEEDRSTYLICSSALLPELSKLNEAPLEIMSGGKTLKSKTSNIYVEQGQEAEILSLSLEGLKKETIEKTQKAFQKLFDVLPDGLGLPDELGLEDKHVLASAFLLRAKTGDNSDRLKFAQLAVDLARKTGDLDLKSKALKALFEVCDYKKLFREVVPELNAVEQVRQLMSEEGFQDQLHSATSSTPSERRAPELLLQQSPTYDPISAFTPNSTPLTSHPPFLSTSYGLITPWDPNQVGRSQIESRLSIPLPTEEQKSQRFWMVKTPNNDNAAAFSPNRSFAHVQEFPSTHHGHSSSSLQTPIDSVPNSQSSLGQNVVGKFPQQAMPMVSSSYQPPLQGSYFFVPSTDQT